MTTGGFRGASRLYPLPPLGRRTDSVTVVLISDNRTVLWRRLRQLPTGWIALSMVLSLRQLNIGYTADGFYRSDDPTNSVKALKEGG